MKVIDLLNKIANGEEVPKKIEYRNIKFLYDKVNKLYTVENYNEYNDLFMELSNHKGTDLNYEVEILEESKGIPEKLDVDEEEKGKYIIWSTEFEQCTTLEMKIIKRQDYIIRKINEILDYLKSKGE